MPTFDSILTATNPNVTSTETAVDTAITNLGANPGTAQMVALQVAMSKWDALVSLQSTCIKKLDDSIKGVLQKVN